MGRALGRAVSASFCVLFAGAAASAYDFNYVFVFGTPDDVTLVGDASRPDAVELTSADDQAGALWHEARHFVEGGFVTTFNFDIGSANTTNIRGDGFAFVIHDSADGVLALGGGGSDLGYGGIARSLAIEFDTFNFVGEPDAIHVAVQTLGALPNTSDATATRAVAVLDPALFPIDDGRTHGATIQYTPPQPGDAEGLLEVFIDEQLVLSLPMTIAAGGPEPYASVVDGEGKSIVGFTASTGLADSRHRISEWAFNANTDACLQPFFWGGFSGSGCGIPDGPCILIAGGFLQGTRPMSLTWMRDGEAITDDDSGRIRGLSSTSIAIENSTSNDHAYYRLEASNACGSVSGGDGFLSAGLYCNNVDFNNDGVFPDDADLLAFVEVLGGGACSGTNAPCDPVDFNNDGVFPDDADLLTFLDVLGGGSCGP